MFHHKVVSINPEARLILPTKSLVALIFTPLSRLVILLRTVGGVRVGY